jgi:hypothetical protein
VVRAIDVEGVFFTQAAVAELTELAQCNVMSLNQREYRSMALLLIDLGCERCIRSLPSEIIS